MSAFLEYDVAYLGIRTPTEEAVESLGTRIALHDDAPQPKTVTIWMYRDGTARCVEGYYEPVLNEGLLTHIREVFYA